MPAELRTAPPVLVARVAAPTRATCSTAPIGQLPAAARRTPQRSKRRRRLLAFALAAAVVIGPGGAAVAAAGTGPAPRTTPPLLRSDEHLLVWDVARGHAAAVVGDLAAASAVAIVVPGVGNSPATFEHGLGGVSRRAPLQMARTLARQMQADAPGVRVAVVAWQDYLPPAGVGLDVAGEDTAQDGAGRLASFVSGLRAARLTVPVTIVGHSYGAVVAGLTARRLGPGAGIDLALLGAPGAGVDVASELPGSRVFAALAADDWMRRVPQVRLLGLGLGRRPASPAFGATLLPSTAVSGHDHYLDPGSSTLRAVARVCLRTPR